MLANSFSHVSYFLLSTDEGNEIFTKDILSGLMLSMPQ